jgi:hypothetical protein
MPSFSPPKKAVTKRQKAMAQGIEDEDENEKE